MTFTSAQSGENWWPHAIMVRFMTRSIDLMEEIARATDNRIAMTRRGYVLAKRGDDVSSLLRKVQESFDGHADLRLHGRPTSSTYQAPRSADWQTAPSGFDVLSNREPIQATFPSYDPGVRNLVHVRRGGDISGQQLGQYMLEVLHGIGVARLTGMVVTSARARAATRSGSIPPTAEPSCGPSGW
jgi:hypothetical protein